MGREESMYGEQRKRVSRRGRGHRGPPEKHVYRVENRQRLQVPGKAWCGESPPGRGNEGGRGSGHPGRRETRVWGEPGPQGKGGHLTADVGRRRKGGEDISRKAIKKKNLNHPILHSFSAITFPNKFLTQYALGGMEEVIPQ